MTPLEHLIGTHDMPLVLVAAAVCLLGSWATSRFFPRVAATAGGQRAGWIVLTSLTCGVSVWCTHFIAMLAHSSSSAVELDGPLTLLSLGIALVGIGAGLSLAAALPSRLGAVLGGLIVGAAIAGLHYTGMAAYQVPGGAVWDAGLVALSILFSLATPAVAMLVARRGDLLGRNGQWLLLALAIVLLHFTGMAAFTAEMGHEHHHGGSTPLAPELQMLVVFISALGFVVVVSGIAAYLIDDRTRAERDEQIRVLETHDPLTGLSNRAGFAERLDAELGTLREHGPRFSVVSIDLNGFKDVNERRGRAVGDELLRAVGRRLAEVAERRNDAFIARVGGDEFAAIVRSGQGLDGFLVDLDRALTAEVVLEPGRSERLPGAAIGVAIHPTDARTAEALMAGAELALQRSKDDPQRRPSFFDRGADQRARMIMELGADLHGAHERDELQLRYLPQLELATRRVVGYEVLVHWVHPTYGPIFEAELGPLAEQNDLVAELGAWALRAACRDAASWPERQRLAVDLAAPLLASPGLIALLRSALEESGLEASRLEIQLTGTAELDDEALAALRGIAALGARIALVGFGAGTTSLATLRAFPFDRVVLAPALVEGASERELAQAGEIVTAVAGLASALGMAVLADGVESDEQLRLLEHAGVTEAQGPALGRPVSPQRAGAPLEGAR